MILEESLNSIFSIAKLIIAVWLFSYTLPRRGRPPMRAVCVIAAVAAISALDISQGFSMYPPLTDWFSFLEAILTFFGVLCVAIVAHQLIFECSPWTSIFCCSMAYSLENLSSSCERATSIYVLNYYMGTPTVRSVMQYWLISAIIYALAYLVLIKRIEQKGLLLIESPFMVITAALAIVVNMMLDLIIKDLGVMDVPRYYQITLVVIYIALCVYIMYSVFEIVYNRRLIMDMAATERLRAAEARQYELSRDNIEAINLKCHDLKHQIRSLRADNSGELPVIDNRVLEDLSREVDIYDSAVKSGNDALDTILTEKGLACEARGITFGCIADGHALDFMDPVDLYSFFGNALDNAIEAASAVDERERRSISLVVQQRSGWVSIHVENFFDGEVRMGADGLPLTSKGDTRNHGFGTQSMRRVVESYGGTLTVDVVEDVYHLNALVPIA